MSVLVRGLKGHEVHTSLPAEVPPVEPVPVLELVPWLPPGEEVVVALVLLMVLPVLAQLCNGFVEERSAILAQPRLLLASGQRDEEDEREEEEEVGLHVGGASVRMRLRGEGSAATAAVTPRMNLHNCQDTLDTLKTSLFMSLGHVGNVGRVQREHVSTDALQGRVNFINIRFNC